MNSYNISYGRLILFILLAPSFLKNNCCHKSKFSVVVHAQEEPLVGLRGSVPATESDDVVSMAGGGEEDGEGNEEQNLDLVEGMMSPTEEDEGGLVMAHSHDLGEPGFLGGSLDPPEEEQEQMNPLPVEQPLAPGVQNVGMMTPPPGDNQMYTTPNPGGVEVLPQSEMMTEGMSEMPMNERMPISDISSVEGQMGPIPNQQQQMSPPQQEGGHMGHSAYPELHSNGPMDGGQMMSPKSDQGGSQFGSQQESMMSENDMVPASKETCPIPAPKVASLEPTMVASYPGSGAKLTWKLIRAVSGYMTSDDAVDLNNLAKHKQVIAIKTHYPARGSSDDFFAPYIDVKSSILLIRNPFHAIPSFLSFLYEQSQNLTGHSVRAPLDVWISWRDRHFEHELGLWVSHARFWMKHHDFENRMILPYEYLIKPGSGPTELRKVRTFLEKHANIEMRTPKEKLACIWDYIVMKREDQGTNIGSKRKGGPKVYPYTPQQLNILKKALEGLKQEFPEELGQLMEFYMYQVNEAMTVSNY